MYKGVDNGRKVLWVVVVVVGSVVYRWFSVACCSSGGYGVRSLPSQVMVGAMCEVGAASIPEMVVMIGSYERLVGLIKRSMRKTIGRSLFDYNQLFTIWPVARDFRPSCKKSEFEKMAIKFCKSAKKTSRRERHCPASWHDCFFLFFGFSRLPLDFTFSWAVPTELWTVEDVH